VDDIVLIHAGKVVLSGELSKVRASFGKNSVRMEFEGNGGFLETLPGVAHATIQQNGAELRLAPGTDPQTVLVAAMGRLRIRLFEVASPSLEEIFIDRVGAGTLEREEERFPAGASGAGLAT
jgi:ABC-2 type transport system ATP-binding protein